MIVITNNAGQLCNKLLLFANCLATGIETSQKVVHLCGYRIRQAIEFDSEIGRREGFFCLPYDGIRQLGTLFFELSKHYSRWTGSEAKFGAKTIQESRAFIDNQFNNSSGFKLITINDWYFRNPDALFRQRKTVLRYLSVKQKYMLRPVTILAAARQIYERVVGVHLRRGDYLSFRGGRYFYTDEIYGKWIGQIAKNAPANTCFLLCSNEPVNFHYFMGLGYNVIVAPNHSIEDLVSLSLCDYILGPPSTYSWWAAFSGDVPLCHLQDEEQTVSYDSFEKPSPGSYP